MGPSKKNIKATKKFEKTHLKGVLERRKVTAKIKQRQQIQDKAKQRRSKDAEFLGKDGQPKRSHGPRDRQVNDMSVDDFFKGGFEEIIETKDGQKAKLGKRKRDDESKATGSAKQEGSDDDESDAMDAQPVASDSDDDDDEDEDGNDAGMTQETMDALAEKDPEFYKFLKENDPDALDFDDNADLAEVDELSAGEDSEADEQDEDEVQPKKKQKQNKKTEQNVDTDSNELTTAILAKWRKSMQEDKSLRATRQVVLAFRCAAHLNEDGDDDSEQKWTINSAEVFNDVLLLALKEIPIVINHHLPVKESASGRVYVQTETKKFSTLSLLLKT
ncbi:hypothetical protein NQ176_g10442 [Zarea fungicola]|uniref:Uncharacterized protein n=1 Tax=Zarea fungicola TaxID=93591 RepID=A0ACC1MGN3_9HYPO|nr:hypothetical protein NQ176_g10442 [Lecanicillium fungicola]